MASSPKLTGSGSIQSHLSTASSRLRISTSTTGISKERDQENQLLSPVTTSPSTKILKFSTLFSRLTSVEIPHPNTSASPRSRASQWAVAFLKLIVVLYCVFSLFFAPYKLHSILRKNKHDHENTIENSIAGSELEPLRYSVEALMGLPDTFQISPVSMLSDALKLSRILSSQPEPKNLEVGAIRSQIHSNDTISLCMWADEAELLSNVSNIMQWGTLWNGPISLVVTTRSEVTSSELERMLATVERKSPGLSLHLLRVKSPLKSHSPNALLNLARLLTSTPYVLLVPDGLSAYFSQDLRDALSTRHDGASLSPFVIIQPKTKLSFPLPRYAPLLVPRDFPSWCTERFFYLTDRAKSWNECLWQLWLESDGKMRAIRAVTTDSQDRMVDASHSDVEVGGCFSATRLFAQ
ncbi:hypothetical protein PQX77_011333 [Marasmius sp. AFHP31]|nr:hypothetical protein PQX77_011333 [Marasmius sp. AFHP31]